jgi:hypothetical protein
MDEFKQFICSNPGPQKKPILAKYSKLCHIARARGIKVITIGLNGKNKADLTKLFNELIQSIEEHVCTGKPVLNDK